MVGTIAHILLYGLPELDELNRPTVFYGGILHDHCRYRGFFDEEEWSKTFPQKEGCRYQLGCKGPEVHCDAWRRGWNTGVNWCVANALCIGCTEPDFWDIFMPFYQQ